MAKKISYLLFIIQLIFPLSAIAIGQITEPIIIENGLRKQEFKETVYIFNADKNNAEVKISAEGDILDWVTFYGTNNQEPIESIIIPGKSQLNLNAIFSIPENTPNGNYSGNISIIKIGGGGESLTVNQKIDREVKIEVNDNEIINFSASAIPNTYDLKQGERLYVKLFYDNKGNTNIAPQVNFKISKNGKIISNIIYPYPDNINPIKPYSQSEIPALEVPTAGLEAGKYLVKTEFINGDRIYAEKDFTLSVGNNNALFGNLAEITKTGPFYGLIAAVLIFIALFFSEKAANITKKILKKYS